MACPDRVAGGEKGQVDQETPAPPPAPGWCGRPAPLGYDPSVRGAHPPTSLATDGLKSRSRASCSRRARVLRSSSSRVSFPKVTCTDADGIEILDLVQGGFDFVSLHFDVFPGQGRNDILD